MGLDSLRTTTNGYSQGRLTSVSSATILGSVAYASSIGYHPNGTLAQIVHGNGVTLSVGADPNAMPRPASFATTGATSNWLTGGYSYDGAGNIRSIGQSRFTYDLVSRLKTADVLVEGATGSLVFADGFESGGTSCWGATEPPLGSPPASCQSGGSMVAQSYSYDAFGNLEQIAGNPGRMTDTDSTTNRLIGASFDAAGNMLAWSGNTYEYDAFGMVTRRCPSGCVAGQPDWRYIYTADDERFWSLGVGGLASTWSLRDLDGKVLREYDALLQPQWTQYRDSIYRDGQLLGSHYPGEGDRFYHLDHLGTPRLITDAGGAKVAYHVYMPFGEEVTSVVQDAERKKFTGHERDNLGTASAGDDQDYMHARHYNPLTARFLSTDTVGGRPGQPQSWNRYAYTHNNPLKNIDPDGHESVGITLDFLNQGLLTGEVSPQEFNENLQGRAIAGVVGGAIGFGVMAATASSFAATTAIVQGECLAFTSAPSASNPILRSVINQLFKAGDRLPGGTANAIRYELATGRAIGGTGGRLHLQAGLERMVRLDKLINSGKLGTADLKVAQGLLGDLQKAVSPVLQRTGLYAEKLLRLIYQQKANASLSTLMSGALLGVLQR